jgi:hypothetical protein
MPAPDRPKRRQLPYIGPSSDRTRAHRVQFRDDPRREYFAVVVVGLADKHRCRCRFALPLRARFALVLRTRSPLRCWCRRDAPPEGASDLGQLLRREPHSSGQRYLGDHESAVMLAASATAIYSGQWTGLVEAARRELLGAATDALGAERVAELDRRGTNLTDEEVATLARDATEHALRV